MIPRLKTSTPICALMVLFVLWGPDTASAHMELVSIAGTGAQGKDDSGMPTLSSGRYVAFQSLAGNLVRHDTNKCSDVFVHDRVSDKLERVSISGTGAQGNNHSILPSLSNDGRYVAFESSASNLVPGDTNGASDIFVYDRETNNIERVSIAGTGEQGNLDSWRPSISDNGRYVAFASFASNLVPNDTNGHYDIFVHDRVTSDTERVSIAGTGAQANNWSHRPSISANGRYVAFNSVASNLVPHDDNNQCDIFVHDRKTHRTDRVSIAGTGAEGNGSSFDPSVSADGRWIAFHSHASNLVPRDTNAHCDIFVHDRKTARTDRASISGTGGQGNGDSVYPCISKDGRYVSFYSAASNLVPNDKNKSADVFIHDRTTEDTVCVSVTPTGKPGNGDSASFAALSPDGSLVAFMSKASNLVPNDLNGKFDVFVNAWH